MPIDYLRRQKYRDRAYRLRSHPETQIDPAFLDRRDSWLTVYLSMVPFLVLELAAEAGVEHVPSGLVFPFGYLMFWAFYYTYYKPGVLEEKLTSPQKWDVSGIPALLVGVFIWFVKVTVVELSQFLLLKWLVGPAKKSDTEREAAEPSYHEKTNPSFRPNPRTQANYQHREAKREAPRPPPPRRPPSNGLPADISAALLQLGLQGKPSWNEIHKRYRELAKQLHPDLNPEITSVGRRFMAVDAAYRRLSQVKDHYFPEHHGH